MLYHDSIRTYTRAKRITALGLCCLLGLSAIQTAIAQGSSELTTKDDLKAAAVQHYEEANRLWSTAAEGSDDETRARHHEARRHLDEAIAALDQLLEEFPDEEKWAEKQLEDAYSLSFWLRRFTALDLDLDSGESEDDEAAPAAAGEPVYDEDDVVGARHASADDALQSAEQAEADDELAAAFYDYLDVVTHHTRSAEAAQLETARKRLREIKEELTTAGVFGYLRQELRSREPVRRAFAAREMGSLRTCRTARALVKRLEKEEDSEVVDAILEAFAHTQKRASSNALGRLARHKDADLRALALEALEHGVGGRHGVAGILEFARDEDDSLVDQALLALRNIGGRHGATALGMLAAGRGTPQQRVDECIDALLLIRSEAAARALVPLCTSRSPYREQAEDALVQMGSPAIRPCIEGLRISRVRKQVHEVLRRITGQTIGMTAVEWHEWHKRFTERGGHLPRFQRGAEPWLGGSGACYTN